MIDIQEIKEKILEFIEKNGPSIPVQIAREIKFDPVWASAILAELVNSKKIFMSSMKIGASSYYYLPGQENELERLGDSVLSGIPKDAFLRLKDNKFLKDGDQDPQIRVALRSLKDFATPFKYDDQVYWRYNFVSKEEVENLLSKPKGLEGDGAVPAIISISSSKNESVISSIDDNGSIESSQDERIDLDPSPEEGLIDRVRECLSRLDIKLLEETESKKREFLGIGRMETGIGEIEVLIVAKDKKSIVEKDILKVYDQVNTYKKISLLLTTGDVAKRAKDVCRDHKDVIKIERI